MTETGKSEVTAGTPSPARLGSLTIRVDEECLLDAAEEEEDLTCPHCGGTGGERFDDGCTTCEYCDGEGYQYWL